MTKRKHIYSIKLLGVEELQKYTNQKDRYRVFECRKVGDAEVTDLRLKQHENAVTQRFENKVDELLPTGQRDYHVHEILKQDDRIVWDGEANEGYFTGREVFYMKDPNDDPSYIDQLVCKIASGSLDLYARKADVTFKPDAVQENAIAWMISKFEKYDSLLIEGAPRVGKSLISMTGFKRMKRKYGLSKKQIQKTAATKTREALSVYTELGYKVILLITPFPDATDSFETIAKFSRDFPDSIYIDARNKIDWDAVDSCNGMAVITASWQLLNEDSPKLKGLFTRGVDAVIVDETHRASDTERSEKLLASIPHEKALHLSGTPYNDKLSGRFSKEQIWTYDIIDMLSDIQAARKSKDGSRLANAPLPVMYLMDNVQGINEELRKKYPDFEDSENQTLEKLGRVQDWVETTLRKMMVDHNNPLDNYATMSSRLKKTLDHIMIYVDSCEVADVFKRALDTLTRENGGWRAYYVASVSGIEENEDFKSVERFINDIQGKYSKTVIISVGKATTGVTLSRLSSIWVMRTIRSAELAVQIFMRAGTSSPGKDAVSILMFDTESALSAIATIAMQRARHTGEPYAECLTRFYRCLPAFVAKANFEFDPLELQEALAFTRDIVAQTKIRVDLSTVDLSTLDLENVKVPKDFNSNRIDATLGLGGLAGGKTKSRSASESKEKDSSSSSTENSAKTVAYILQKMDILVLRGIRTVDDLRELPAEDIIDSVGVSKVAFLKIVEAVGVPQIQRILDNMYLCFLEN